MRPPFAVLTFLQKDAAHDAVWIEFQVDMTEAAGGSEEIRRRHQSLEAGAGTGDHDRQHCQLAGGKRLGQCAVVCALAGRLSLLGFRHDDIEPDCQRVGVHDPVQQLGVQTAVPWPAAEFADAVIVDGDDDDVVARRPRIGSHELVIQGSVETAEAVHITHAAGHDQHQDGNRHPLAKRHTFDERYNLLDHVRLAKICMVAAALG